MADFRAYVDCQKDVARAYRDRDRWTRMSILTVARMGKFSSDRAIREYAEKIWTLRPLAATLGAASPGARPPGAPYEAV